MPSIQTTDLSMQSTMKKRAAALFHAISDSVYTENTGSTCCKTGKKKILDTSRDYMQMHVCDMHSRQKVCYCAVHEPITNALCCVYVGRERLVTAEFGAK